MLSRNIKQVSKASVSVSRKLVLTRYYGSRQPLLPTRRSGISYLGFGLAAAAGGGLILQKQLFGTAGAADVSIPEELHAEYLLIGGGVAAFSAARTILKTGQSNILILTEENDRPYARPPLSKGLWTGCKDDAELSYKQFIFTKTTYFKPENSYISAADMARGEKGIGLMKNARVVKIDTRNNEVRLENGRKITYSHLLLATGGVAKSCLPFDSAAAEVKNNVLTYRNMGDYQECLKISQEKDSVAVIGAGFLGTELAASLANKGKKRPDKKDLEVCHIHTSKGVFNRVFPGYLAEAVAEQISTRLGVKTFSEATVAKATTCSNKIDLELTNGKHVLVDKAVVCVGIDPRNDLADGQEIKVDPNNGGIVVDQYLRVMGQSNVFAAGDCASFEDTIHGRRRIEHEMTAETMGEYVGKAMTCAKTDKSLPPYSSGDWWYSGIPGWVGVFHGIGDTKSSHQSMGVFRGRDKNVRVFDSSTTTKVPHEELDYGVVLYTDNHKKLVGVTFWNLRPMPPGPRKKAETLIKEKQLLIRDADDAKTVAKELGVATKGWLPWS